MLQLVHAFRGGTLLVDRGDSYCVFREASHPSGLTDMREDKWHFPKERSSSRWLKSFDDDENCLLSAKLLKSVKTFFTC